MSQFALTTEMYIQSSIIYTDLTESLFQPIMYALVLLLVHLFYHCFIAASRPVYFPVFPKYFVIFECQRIFHIWFSLLCNKYRTTNIPLPVLSARMQM